MKQEFIFGGDTGKTYQEIKRRRELAEKLLGSLSDTPKNVGEGLNAIGRALMYRGQMKRSDAAQEKLAQAIGYDHPLMQKLMGIPQYRYGTKNHPGGPALVGEDGPEIAWLPRGSAVSPNPNTALPPDRQREFEAMTPEQRAIIEQLMNGGATPDDAFTPEGADPRSLIMEQGALNDARAYKVADAGNVASDAYPIKPAGVGEQSDINRAAYAYRTFNNALDDYNRIVSEGGVAIIPGAQKDAIDVSRRNLQMQMKELYNLGVLNGPDLDLMNQIIIDPTGLGNKALDVLGIADTETRVSKNIEQVRGIMRQLVEPKLKAIGATPEDVYSPQDMSDEEFLKSLGL